MEDHNTIEHLNNLYVRELRRLSPPKWPDRANSKVELNEKASLPTIGHRRRIYGSFADIDVDGKEFIRGGFEIATRIMNIYEAYSDRNFSDLRVLDWGVGCGRVTRHFRQSSEISVDGIDVDPINIEWMHQNFPNLNNYLVDTNAFNLVLNESKYDLIYSYSVMSHLNPKFGLPWLAAISNYCSDLMLISTHGFRNAFEHRWSENSGSMQLFLDKGYVGEDSQNYDIADVTPKKYYGDYQFSYTHIHDEWSKVVQIIDVIPMGLGHHDLVVCRPI